MAASPQPTPEQHMDEVESMILAWEKYQQSDGGHRQNYYLGLKVGQNCCAVRRKFRARGSRKGLGFQAVLKQAHIPMQTAYRWINQYEACDVTPEEWIARENAKLASADEAARERGRKASREFQRRLRGFLKIAESALREADQIVKANWQPKDWDQKPEQWRTFGKKLLSCDYVSNSDLKGWASMNGHELPSLKTVQRIRDWVGRPLGPYGKPVDTLPPRLPQPVPLSYRLTALKRKELNKKAADARWGKKTPGASTDN
jgi:hypothetical protein